LQRSERILVVTQQLGPVRTGVGTYANHLVEGLRDHGYRVKVATFPGGCNTVPGVEYLRLPRLRWDPTPGNWYSVSHHFARAIRPDMADLVHFADAREAFRYRGAIPAVGMVHDAYALDSPRTPWALRRHHPDWGRRGTYYAALRRVEPVAYRKLRFLMANAEDTRLKVVRGYRLDPRRAKVVHLGIEQPENVEAISLDGNPSVLFAGSNYFRKGLGLLLQAMHRTLGNLPGLRLHVVGVDSNQRAANVLAKRLGVEDRIHFHGRVQRQELLQMMAGADTLCMPSRTEGYGLVFLEAMAVGTPVIGGRVGGTRELIRHGENGLLTSPEDPVELATHLLKLHREPKLRKCLAREGMRTASLHSVQGMMQETLAVYQSLGMGRRPRVREAVLSAL